MNDISHDKKQLLIENNQLKAKIAELEQKAEISQIIAERAGDSFSISSFDLKAKYLYVSPSIKHALDYDPQDLIGKSFFDFIHPDDKKVLLLLIKNYISKKVKNLLNYSDPKISETIEYRFKDKAGNWHYYQSKINFIGKNLLSISRDISEQKQAELDYKNLFESAHDAIIIFNPDNEIVLDVNERACQIYGFSRKEFIGMSLLSISKNPDIGKDQVSKTLNKGFNQWFETIQYKNDASEIYFEINASVIDYKGQKAILSINRDITERKQIELIIQENFKQQQLVLNSLPIVFYTTDTSAIMANTWISEQVESITGFTADQMISDPFFWEKRIHPDDKTRTQAEYYTVFEKEFIETEYRWKIASGSYKWFQDKIVLLRDENNNPKQIIGLWIDITERKQAEDELKIYRENLEELVNERTAELEEKNAELERFNDLFVGREFRIKELRDKVKELENKMNQ